MARHCRVPAVLSRAGSLFRASILALFAASLLVAMPPAGRNARVRIVQAASRLGEDSRQARRRALGAAWVDAEAAIRRAIPADGEYLLVDGGAERQGATLFLRYQLAPRRARFAGRLSEIADSSRWEAALPAGPRWVVVAYPRRPPVLVARSDFARWVKGTLGRR
ncbi:MAG TPA: hypothetical protein VFC23_14480 [Thermoanaerobaculia bacterium]|nr:hypothetical protein [Thermoanaerobaculia bacterium]